MLLSSPPHSPLPQMSPAGGNPGLCPTAGGVGGSHAGPPIPLPEKGGTGPDLRDPPAGLDRARCTDKDTPPLPQTAPGGAGTRTLSPLWGPSGILPPPPLGHHGEIFWGGGLSSSSLPIL